MTEETVKLLWPASNGTFYAEYKGRRGYLREDECTIDEDGEMYIDKEVMEGKSWS